MGEMMEKLFDGNIIFIFFFSMIAIYNYSNLKEYQRIAIIYITIYSLVVFEIISVKLAIILLLLSLFCFLEVLSSDETKFKILVKPIYKIIDCLYISISQYAFLKICFAIILYNNLFLQLFHKFGVVFKMLSVIFFIMAITSTLQQKFVISSFKEMYKLFRDYPINKVEFNEKLNEASSILVSIEDRMYFERKGYTFLSLDSIVSILKEKLNEITGYRKFIYFFKSGRRFVENAFNEERGYSTIPMQLIRSLGIKRGYNYKYRRKIFEILYSRMFFKGIERMFEEDKVSNREHVKKYYLYIYFHKVNTFLEDANFSKFLNAFDMQYNYKNKKDIYDCSNEGIFIACMGLSKRTSKINKDNIDYYLGIVDDVNLNKDVVCDMLSNMMKKPYEGNYLK